MTNPSQLFLFRLKKRVVISIQCLEVSGGLDCLVIRSRTNYCNSFLSILFNVDGTSAMAGNDSKRNKLVCFFSSSV